MLLSLCSILLTLSFKGLNECQIKLNVLHTYRVVALFTSLCPVNGPFCSPDISPPSGLHLQEGKHLVGAFNKGKNVCESLCLLVHI